MSTRVGTLQQAWPLVAAGLVLLWLMASAASRGQGFLFFAAGVAVLAWALHAFTRGRRDRLYGVIYLLLLGDSAALAFEGALHARPALLRGRLANIAYTGYHWQGGGIYDLDTHRGPVLRADVRRRLYWNGYWWNHSTSASGWRGREVANAQAVFVGDSMIYGHGVEEPQTVSARYSARTGQPAVNLGQQGTCQMQSLQTLALALPRLRARIVYASLHPTDIGEASRYYDDLELRRFAEAADGRPYAPFARAEYGPRAWWNPVWLWSRHLALPLRCAGLLGALARFSRPESRFEQHVHRDPFVPSAEETHAALPALAAGAADPAGLPWRAERRAVLEMKRLCDRLGARLVLLDLGYPEALTRATEALAHELGAEYSDAGRQILVRAQAGERLYLADDGHWSPAGHDALAALLADQAQSRVHAP